MCSDNPHGKDRAGRMDGDPVRDAGSNAGRQVHRPYYFSETMALNIRFADFTKIANDNKDYLDCALFMGNQKTS